MSDITGSIRPENIITIADSTSGASVVSIIIPQFGGTSIVFLYLQRIYDNTLGQYVYYKLSRITTSPGSTQTNPNHTGNLDVNRHEIVAVLSDVV